MGSYLTIVNNTPDNWLCKIGPDDKIVNLTGMILAMFAASFFAISGAMSAPPLLITSAFGGTFMSVTGITAPAIITGSKWGGSMTNLIACLTWTGMTTTTMSNYELKKRGFDPIPSGQSHRYGRMTLSLWQQAQCIRTTKVNDKTLWVDTLIMRPIFSGATANSNKNYDIQTYVQRNKSLTRTVVAAIDPVTGENRSNVTRRLEVGDDSKVFMILPNGKVVDDKGMIVDLSK